MAKFSLAPTSPRQALIHAQSFDGPHRAARAAAYLDEALLSWPGDVALLTYRAKMFEQLNDPSRAERLFLKARDLDPTDARTLRATLIQKCIRYDSIVARLYSTD